MVGAMDRTSAVTEAAEGIFEAVEDVAGMAGMVVDMAGTAAPISASADLFS
jgi:hypothetical protein